MRFTTLRDYQTFILINQELINNVIDVPVVIYKLQQSVTKTNSYGEAPKKTWYTGVIIPLLYMRDVQSPLEDMKTINAEQSSEFYFLRYECAQRNIYPEQGDIINFDGKYYEIDNINEIQLWAGREEYRWQVMCNSHLTRNSNLQLEPPQI